MNHKTEGVKKAGVYRGGRLRSTWGMTKYLLPFLLFVSVGISQGKEADRISTREAMIKKFDKNGDEMITWEECWGFLKKHAP